MPSTLNTCHSIHFDAFFQVKMNKMWNFCLKFWFLQELLIIETWNLHHWIQHASNPKYKPLKPFQCIFPSQNQHNVKFLAVCLTPPDKKRKNINLYREKVFEKAWKSAHISFWICQAQCTMLELCVTSTIWVMMVSLYFDRKFRHRVLKHGVGVEWDPRRTAA